MTKDKFNLPKSYKTKRQTTGFTTKTGKLRKNYLPASYCDTSFLIDYWTSIKLQPVSLDNFSDEEEHYPILREQIKRYKRLRNIYKIREKIDNYDNVTTPVFSTIAVYEFAEKIAEGYYLSEVVKATDIFSGLHLGRKQIGDFIQTLWKKTNNLKQKNKYQDDPLSTFTISIFENMCSYRGDKLFGMLPVDFENITIRTPRDFNKIITLAAFQIGVADMLHLESARRLGCTYFITLDNDFVKAKEEIANIFGLEVLSNPQEILKKI